MTPRLGGSRAFPLSRHHPAARLRDDRQLDRGEVRGSSTGCIRELDSARRDGVALLVIAVPALLVVVLGYVIGYSIWEASGVPGSPEPAGWTLGLGLLAVTTWVLLSRVHRLRRKLRRARHAGDDEEVARLRAELARPRRRSRG